MEALQEWIERERFITTLWFLTKWGRIQLLITLTLWRPSPISLSLSIYLYFFAIKINFLLRNDQGLFISFLICINSPRKFLCSPWRVEVSSPMGLCHVIKYLSAFSLITCKTSNKSALNLHLNYYFLALIKKLLRNFEWGRLVFIVKVST